MRKTLTFLIAVTLPFFGMGAGVYWNAGQLSWSVVSGPQRYSWDIEIAEDVFIGFTFDVAVSGVSLVISPGWADYWWEEETWVKRCHSEDLITKDTIKDGYFIAPYGGGDDEDPTFKISRNGRMFFGYAVCFYNSVWVYGWVNLFFKEGVPQSREGCYVIGEDGIYAGTSNYIPGPQIVECPEPASAALLAIGIVALALRRGQRVA